VLLYVAAPALWGELAQRYGALANDPNRALCDEHLLGQLLGDTISRRELARALDPDAPLVRRGLVRVGERARPFQPLSVDPIVVKLLAGYDLGGDEPGLQRVDLGVALEHVVAPPAVIERALAELAGQPAGRARVVVRGRTGSGRRTLLAALARRAESSLAMVDVAALVRDGRLGELSLLLQHASLRGWLPCVDGFDAIASDDAGARSVVRDVIRDHHGPVAMRLPHHVQAPIDPDHVLVELSPLTAAERAEQWQAALSEHGRTVRDLDALAGRFVVGAGTIRRVATVVARGAERDTDRAADSAVRQHLGARLPSIATRVTQLASWSHVILPSEIQRSIDELVARVRHRHTVFDAWGFDRLMSASRGVTALFQGDPGTGKTLVAGAIASDLGVDLYRIDLARIVSTWSSAIEQDLGTMFDIAEQAQAVTLLEEADSLVATRAGTDERAATVALAYLLQRLDASDGITIVTLNAGAVIDEPLARRMSAHVTLPFPDEAARERLWRVHLPDELPVRGTIDLAALARQNRMSGGDIRDAALRAAFLAAAESSPLTQEHLERAVRSELFEATDR
jgi:AAA+ superfamily predicted ATPase